MRLWIGLRFQDEVSAVETRTNTFVRVFDSFTDRILFMLEIFNYKLQKKEKCSFFSFLYFFFFVRFRDVKPRTDSHKHSHRLRRRFQTFGLGARRTESRRNASPSTGTVRTFLRHRERFHRGTRSSEPILLFVTCRMFVI